MPGIRIRSVRGGRIVDAALILVRIPPFARFAGDVRHLIPVRNGDTAVPVVVRTAVSVFVQTVFDVEKSCGPIGISPETCRSRPGISVVQIRAVRCGTCKVICGDVVESYGNPIGSDIGTCFRRGRIERLHVEIVIRITSGESDGSCRHGSHCQIT